MRCYPVTPPTRRRCGVFSADRTAIRQGAPRLADGSRRADRGGARRDARCRPAGTLSGGHAEGPPDTFGEASDRSAVATGATRRARQALGATRRALCSGTKPRPRRQGAGNAATPVEAVVGAAQATVDDAADA